jgi:hypothetical protein
MPLVETDEGTPGFPLSPRPPRPGNHSARGAPDPAYPDDGLPREGREADDERAARGGLPRAPSGLVGVEDVAEVSAAREVQDELAVDRRRGPLHRLTPDPGRRSDLDRPYALDPGGSAANSPRRVANPDGRIRERFTGVREGSLDGPKRLGGGGALRRDRHLRRQKTPGSRQPSRSGSGNGLVSGSGPRVRQTSHAPDSAGSFRGRGKTSTGAPRRTREPFRPNFPR